MAAKIVWDEPRDSLPAQDARDALRRLEKHIRVSAFRAAAGGCMIALFIHLMWSLLLPGVAAPSLRDVSLILLLPAGVAVLGWALGRLRTQRRVSMGSWGVQVAQQGRYSWRTFTGWSLQKGAGPRFHSSIILWPQGLTLSLPGGPEDDKILGVDRSFLPEKPLESRPEAVRHNPTLPPSVAWLFYVWTMAGGLLGGYLFFRFVLPIQGSFPVFALASGGLFLIGPGYWIARAAKQRGPIPRRVGLAWFVFANCGTYSLGLLFAGIFAVR